MRHFLLVKSCQECWYFYFRWQTTSLSSCCSFSLPSVYCDPNILIFSKLCSALQIFLTHVPSRGYLRSGWQVVCCSRIFGILTGIRSMNTHIRGLASDLINDFEVVSPNSSLFVISLVLCFLKISPFSSPVRKLEL